MQLHDRIARRRIETNIGIELIADLTGCSVERLHGFEQGADLTLSETVKFAELVGLTVIAVDTPVFAGLHITERSRSEPLDNDVGDTLPEDVRPGN